MGKSAEQFLAIREMEVMEYDPSFSKKEVQEQGKKAAKEILDRGNVTPLKALANVTRLKEFINSLDSELRGKITVTEKTNESGIEISVKNSGDRLDYEKDPECKRLMDQVKERQEELKKAFKMKQKGKTHYIQAFDPETGEEIAVEVPVVPIKTHGKMTLNLNF